MRILQGISAWLAKWTPAVVAAAAVAAYFLPGAFDWVRGNAQTSVLGGIMLTMGLTLTSEDFCILAKRPLDIAIGSMAQFTLMPLIAWSLVHLLGLPKAVGVGLILVGCCPGGVSSNIMSFLCKGDVAFSVGLTTLSTLAAPLTTPLLMLWLAGENVDVDAIGMFKSILIITHSTRILEALKVDYTHILVDGRIVKTGGPELVEEINRDGFEKYVN